MRSIASRITRTNMLVSGTALLLAVVGFGVLDVLTLREALVRNLATQAQIVGHNSVSALLFNDPATAEETLSALAAAPGVEHAEVFTLDGRSFARYARTPSAAASSPQPALARDRAEVSAITLTAATVIRRIDFDGMPTGFVYIRSSLDELYADMGRRATVAALVIALALAAGWLTSRVVSRTLVRPIASVAALARRVSGDRDYTARAEVDSSTAEMHALASAFNAMLSEIQRQDTSLREARATLEQRVVERTAALDATNRELEAFSYSVSHDLRAPLRHVTGFANMLAAHAGDRLDERGRRYVATITEAAGRMGALIDDLLAFSRLGRSSLTKRRVDLAALVQRARADVLADVNGRRVTWDIAPLPHVDADPALLTPALVNLLSNAVKYTGTREEARIAIGTLPAGASEVIVYVRDNGVGFDMKYASKLFGVFQRLHRSDQFEGTGIGLATVQRIIARHGGRIWAEGAVGEGATFYFSLPADPTMEATHAR